VVPIGFVVAALYHLVRGVPRLAGRA